jgi:hypothetical protein
VLFVRLKQCEHALSDGRLDEAFDLLRQPDMRAHRAGQELIGKLVPALVERGRRHLAAGRLLQAAADCGRAGQIGGNRAEIAQLRAAVNNAMRITDNNNRQIGQAVAAARRHADQGQLSVGQQLLGAIDTPDARVDGLKQDLIARRAGVESRLKKATEALDAGDWETAVDHLAAMGRGDAADTHLRQLCGKISRQVSEEINREFESGRVNVAAALLGRLDRLPVQSVETDQVRKTLEQCRLACNAVETNQPRTAEDILRRLGAIWPNAAWLGHAVEQSKQLGDALSQVHGGPLFLVEMTTPLTPPLTPSLQPNRAAAPPATPLSPPPLPQPNAMARNSYCLHVDGVGSFQIITNPSVSIGPAGSSRSVDIPLMLDAGVPTITVTRSDDDYFLRSGQPVLVNQVQTTNKLLHDGDRIGLGNLCRLTFRRPSAASVSAVLDLSGARLPGATIRQVILMDRELIIGPGTAAHVRVDDLAAPVVLQRRGEGMYCRSAAEILLDDKPAGTAAEIPVGSHVQVGSLHFVVAREQRS